MISIKQEKDENFDLGIESNNTENPDGMKNQTEHPSEIKIEDQWNAIKTEPISYVAEGSNLNQKLESLEDYKLFDYADKSILESSRLKELLLCDQKGLDVKLEDGEELAEMVKIEDYGEETQTILNDELNIKDEEETSRRSLELFQTDKITSKRDFSCEQCDFTTTQQRFLNTHLLRHQQHKKLAKCSSNLSAKSKVARRMAEARKSEPFHKTQKRLEDMRAYVAGVRANESACAREKRLAALRARAAEVRSNERPTSRAKRLSQMRSYNSKARSEESPESRERRLSQMRSYAVRMRSQESASDRERRLASRRAYISRVRREERERKMLEMMSSPKELGLFEFSSWGDIRMYPSLTRQRVPHSIGVRSEESTSGEMLLSAMMSFPSEK